MKSICGCLLRTAAMSTARALACAMPEPSTESSASTFLSAASHTSLSEAEPSIESLATAMASATARVWA